MFPKGGNSSKCCSCVWSCWLVQWLCFHCCWLNTKLSATTSQALFAALVVLMYCVVKSRQPKGLSSLLMFLWHEVPWAVVKSQEFNSRAANLGSFSGQYINCGNCKQLKGIWFLKDQMSQLRGFHLPLWAYFIQALVWNWGNGNWAQVPSCLWKFWGSTRKLRDLKYMTGAALVSRPTPAVRQLLFHLLSWVIHSGKSTGQCGFIFLYSFLCTMCLAVLGVHFLPISRSSSGTGRGEWQEIP